MTNNFPKLIMPLKEFSEYTGLPYSRVKEMVHIPRQSFAFRNPGGRKWYINVKKYSDWEDRQTMQR